MTSYYYKLEQNNITQYVKVDLPADQKFELPYGAAKLTSVAYEREVAGHNASAESVLSASLAAVEERRRARAQKQAEATEELRAKLGLSVEAAQLLGGALNA